LAVRFRSADPGVGLPATVGVLLMQELDRVGIAKAKDNATNERFLIGGPRLPAP
jgi:hypothetical protein